MAAPDNTPLPSAPNPAVEPKTRHTGPRPYRWADRGIVTKAFPVVARTVLGPIELAQFESTAVQALESRGLEVVFDFAPETDGRPSSDSLYDRHRGLIVGERGVRIEESLRRRFRRLAFALIAVGVVFAVLTVLVNLSGPTTLLPAIPAIFLFIIGGSLFTPSGAFASEAVWIQYWASSSNTSPPSDSRSSVELDVSIGAGTIVSQNAGGRGGRRRFCREVRSGESGLAGLPDELVQQFSAGA